MQHQLLETTTLKINDVQELFKLKVKRISVCYLPYECMLMSTYIIYQTHRSMPAVFDEPCRDATPVIRFDGVKVDARSPESEVCCYSAPFKTYEDRKPVQVEFV